MAELEGAVESKKENKAEATHEPSTNKVWDQSEHDRAIAEALRAERAKFSDYDEIKKSFEALQKEREEAELKEKSELERKDHELTKVSQELEALRNANKTFELKDLRNKVLSDPKYSKLPAAYRNMVELSESEVDLQASADAVLEQFQKDFDVVGQSFGKPVDPKPPAPAAQGNPKDANDLRSRLRAKLQLGR